VLVYPRYNIKTICSQAGKQGKASSLRVSFDVTKSDLRYAEPQFNLDAKYSRFNLNEVLRGLANHDFLTENESVLILVFCTHELL